MSSDWGAYESRQIGDWRLDSLLGVRGERAYFLTRNPSDGRALLVEAADIDGEGAALLASWNRANKIAEPGLLKVHAAGEADLDGQRVAFAVLDLPDDDLGEVLTRTLLPPAEARKLFYSIAKVLDALHRRGLSHGDVRPSSIFIVDGQVRLSVDTIAPATEPAKRSDLRQFGASMIQALIGRLDAAATEEPELLEDVAQLEPPFYAIAVGSLSGSRDKQWSAAQISEALSEAPPEPKHVVPEPPPGFRPAGRATAENRNLAARHSFASWLGGPQWPIMATAGIVAIVLGIYLLVHGPRPRPIAPAATPPAREQPAEVREEPRVAEAPPEPVPTRGAAERTTPAPEHSGHWAVIAATYGSFEGAEKLAKKIERRTPALHPHVFPPAGRGKHYFVVLGSGLTQDEAERLRRNARSQGAPHDTYVTKLDES